MILLIDSYDSFANNLSRLISSTTNKKVITIYNDTIHPQDYDTFFNSILPSFEYVIVGPGPGHPSILKDVGIIPALFKHASREASIPILGICLGFQCLCYEFGNEVERLDDVKHGQIYDIHPIAEGLYSGEKVSFPSVRYHSLYVDIEKLNDNIVPLAVCYEPNNKPDSAKTILMAAKHQEYPFYGVQYHPESICSEQGDKLVRDFDTIANEYHQKHGKDRLVDNNDEAIEEVSSLFRQFSIQIPGLVQSDQLTSIRDTVNILAKKVKFSLEISSIDVCEYFNKKNGSPDFVLLNSASSPGEWSIIGVPIKGQSEVLTHSVDNINTVSVGVYGSQESNQVSLLGTVWDFVAQNMEQNFISRDKFDAALGPDFHSRPIPFLGGYIGMFSYEEGKHILFDKLESLCTGATPDMKLMFIERFVVFDHLTKDCFIISIFDDDKQWVDTLHQELIAHDAAGTLQLDADTVAKSVADLCRDGESITFDFPDRDIYKKQFQQCQELLHSGDSYELCLTTSLKISVPSYVKPWDIYKILTIHKNPSPFSCYMSFDDVNLLSSSPERFLSWKDGSNKRKVIELRPIKGTVKKTPGVDLEVATKLLKTPKEMGENLMIVDLIRHDLHAFIDHVYVSQLMAIEEYKTVYQLVSVIGGELQKKYHGVDILHHSLPPGSMTGAPKKRSVELLQEIESLQPNGNRGGRRGVYSGVVGYWSVTDDSDWSVVIRSVFHYNSDKQNLPGTNIWRIGAGGAITVLSDMDDEWEEMEIKLSSALQAFQ